MEKVYASPLKNYLTRSGFVAISNILLDYQEELGLTEGELIFIIKILRHKNGFILHDKDIDPTLSTKTLSRRRNSLKEKGYLNFTVVKKQDEVGAFATTGISYDFSPLEEMLQKISDRLEEKKEEVIKKTIANENLITEKKEEKSPIENYKNDFKACYGIQYALSDYEIKYYNNLPEEDKNIISYIFNYCKDNDLLDKIVPRLSLFFKTPFRFEELKKYYYEKIKTDDLIEETNIDILNKNIEELTNNIYKMYYNNISDNFPFYSAVKRYVYKYIDSNGSISSETYDKMLKLVEMTYNKFC